jgi:hypothetical protein
VQLRPRGASPGPGVGARRGVACDVLGRSEQHQLPGGSIEGQRRLEGFGRAGRRRQFHPGGARPAPRVVQRVVPVQPTEQDQLLGRSVIRHHRIPAYRRAGTRRSGRPRGPIPRPRRTVHAVQQHQLAGRRVIRHRQIEPRGRVRPRRQVHPPRRHGQGGRRGGGNCPEDSDAQHSSADERARRPSSPCTNTPQNLKRTPQAGRKRIALVAGADLTGKSASGRPEPTSPGVNSVSAGP